MDNQTSLTPFELELKDLLAMPEPNTTFVRDLRSTLINTPYPSRQQRISHNGWNPVKAAFRKPAWVWAAAVVLAVLAIFISVGPERVLAEARRILSGFIPGVGFVDNQSSLRVLEKPVQISVEGASIVIEKGFTNANETEIQIHYLDDSRSCKNTNTNFEQYRSALNEKVFLLLPDGRMLFAITPRFSNWGKFPPIPEGINEAVLVVPPNVIHACPVGDPNNTAAPSTFCQCLDDDLRWMVQLKFIAPPPGAVLPVVDNATPTALPVTVVTPQPNAASATQTAPIVAVQPELVGKLVTLDDGYLLLAAIKRDPNSPVSFSFGMNERHFELVDAAGNKIPVDEVDRSEVPPDVFKDFDWGDMLLLRTHTKDITGPLTLSFPSLVQAQYQFGKEAEFEINLGANLQVGQQIPLQNSFDFIPGHPFTLQKAAIDSLDANNLGVTLSFVGEGFETIQVNPVPFPDPPPQGGSSGQCSDFPGCFYTSTSLTPSPDNHYRLAVSGEDHSVTGPWSLIFDPGKTTP